jgi:orotate phosphoribosyltransferase
MHSEGFSASKITLAIVGTCSRILKTESISRKSLYRKIKVFSTCSILSLKLITSTGLLCMKTLYICSMKQRYESALNIAEFLLQIKAVKLQPQNPFTWASGIKSPIYCDNRVILSYPKIRTFFRQEFIKLIDEEFGKPDVIAGVATGAIAHGVLVAEALGLPFVYVRPEAKSHGLGNQIEGVLTAGQSVVVIEDLISTGGSSIKAVKALKAAGAIVKGLVAIFTYGFQQAIEAFESENCSFYTLTDYSTLIEKAIQSNYINSSDIESLNDWRKDPSNWKI